MEKVDELNILLGRLSTRMAELELNARRYVDSEYHGRKEELQHAMWEVERLIVMRSDGDINA